MTKLDSQAAPTVTAESNPAESSRPKRRFLQSWRDHPVSSYYLLLVITWLLLVIDLITVFSAAIIAALDQKSNPFLAFGKHSLIYLASLAVMFVVSRIGAVIYKRLAWCLLGASWSLQALAFLPSLHGVNAGGNTNWPVIPGIGFSTQPSELMKLALVIFLGATPSDSRLRHKSTRNFPLYSIGGVADDSIVLVTIGRNPGIAMVMSSLILVAFLITGIRLRHLVIIVVRGADLTAVGVMSSPGCRRWVPGFVGTSTTSPTGVGYQRQHGLRSLTTGGLTGVGSGASREKWFYLPEAGADYIFAVLGEESGLAGTFWVLTLLILLCLTLTRMMRRSTTSFKVYTLAGIMGWSFFQAIINIGVVVDLLPIIGVPPPLISSGGPSILPIMGAIGVVLPFARHESGAQEVLQARLRPMKRSLATLAGSSVKSSKSRRIKRQTGDAKQPVIVFASGGTASHVNPLLSTVAALYATGLDFHPLVLGTKEGLESELALAADLELATIPRLPVPHQPSSNLATSPLRLRRTVKDLESLFSQREATALVGFGGYVSAPGYLAAHHLKIPFLVHEQNACPGMVNRLGARWAKAVALTFPETPLRSRRGKTEVTGLPLRPAMLELASRLATTGDRLAARAATVQFLGLSPGKLTVLVTGGPLGIAFLNQTLSTALARVPGDPPDLQAVHLTGKDKDRPVRQSMSEAGLQQNYKVLDYLSEMHHALVLADAVVCRAGAATVAENSALGLPVFYAPLPVSNGEQSLNALSMVEPGGAPLLNQRKVKPTEVAVLIERTLDPAKNPEICQAAAGTGTTKGAANLAKLIQEVLWGTIHRIFPM